MAALNAMRTMLQRIGLSAAASQVIVDEQGLDSLNEIRLLTDDEIESFARSFDDLEAPFPDPTWATHQSTTPGLRSTFALRII
jgi:hypothetical protein